MDLCRRPKDEVHSHCGRLCSKDNVTYLITRLELVEGEILERMEKCNHITVHELMQELTWQPCAIAMALGSLMRQGIILSIEEGENIVLRAA